MLSRGRESAVARNRAIAQTISTVVCTGSHAHADRLEPALRSRDAARGSCAYGVGSPCRAGGRSGEGVIVMRGCKVISQERCTIMAERKRAARVSFARAKWRMVLGLAGSRWEARLLGNVYSQCSGTGSRPTALYIDVLFASSGPANVGGRFGAN